MPLVLVLLPLYSPDYGNNPPPPPPGSAEHWQIGQMAMTAVGQAQPEPNADTAT